MANDTADKGQEVLNDVAYLRYMPEHLRERYLEGLNDGQLTHLRRQIALMDVRVKMLLEALDRQVLTEEKITAQLSAEFPDLDEKVAQDLAAFLSSFLPESFIDTRTFRSLERLAHKYEKAMVDQRLLEAGAALKSLLSAIHEGRREGEIWKEIDAVMDSRRKLVEAEERRLVQTQQSITIDRVVIMLGATIQALKEAVVRYVPDRQTQQYILVDAERIYASHLGGDEDPAADTGRVDRLNLPG